MFEVFKKGNAVSNPRAVKEASMIASLVALLVPVINMMFGINLPEQEVLAVVAALGIITHAITSTNVGF